jgi:DNA replication initiation complex subunit (GINS family)
MALGDRSEQEKRYHSRKNSLTQEDLENITSIFESIVHKRTHNDASCRFYGIKPADLKSMVDSFKKFSVAMDDSRSIVRKFILIAILTALSGFAAYGYWSKVTETAKKMLTP